MKVGCRIGIVALMTAACPSDVGRPRTDAGAPDAAEPDAGGGELDAGAPDAEAEPDAATPDAGPDPSEILRVDFDDATVGPYTRAALAADWPGVPWAIGPDEGRVAIVEGAESFEGRSLRVLFPAGVFGVDGGGALWPVDLGGTYEELYLSYRVRFAPGFDFVRGGKLPGLVGGEANTGGEPPDGTDGWSARMMWRVGGDVVQYVYHPDQPGTFGEDFPWDLGGDRLFEPGAWHQVEHRIVMNTPGQHDGVVQGWWDGALALDRQDIRFRDVDTFAIDALQVVTFFGGSDATWAASRDEYVYFDDFVVSTEPITH
jgi:hypothetical protein